MTISLDSDTLAAALGCSKSRAEAWLPQLGPALTLAKIDTDQRLACFLAQLGHESLSFSLTRELWGPTVQQRRYEPTTTLSKSLGNIRPGDGKRYMGRGLIQITGRSNYAQTTLKIRAACGEKSPDFVTAPAFLETPEWAALSAAIYWRDRKLNTYADANDFVTLTKRINGGINGIGDRQMRYATAMGVLS